MDSWADFRALLWDGLARGGAADALATSPPLLRSQPLATWSSELALWSSGLAMRPTRDVMGLTRLHRIRSLANAPPCGLPPNLAHGRPIDKPADT
jgi:hypothetical protein